MRSFSQKSSADTYVLDVSNNADIISLSFVTCRSAIISLQTEVSNEWQSDLEEEENIL